MARSKWKNKYFSLDLWKKIILLKRNKIKKALKSKKYFRASTVPKCFISKKIILHKGNVFKTLKITKYLIGYKFGEFAFTRKPFFYPKKIVAMKKKR